MNWAIGHGSRGGRWARKRGKCRIKTRTNSLLCSQKVERSSRSSSGVRRSEEKMVVGGEPMTIGATGAGWRLFRWVFMSRPSPKKVSRAHVAVRPSRFPYASWKRHTALATGERKATTSPQRTTSCTFAVVVFSGVRKRCVILDQEGLSLQGGFPNFSGL